MSDFKLQKVLADLGLGSRREMERWIEAGRVKVNSAVAKIGDRVDLEKDKIFVDGRLVGKIKNKRQETRVLLYHKPEGEVCSRKDPDHQKTIFDRLPKLKDQRWVAIGRLDLNTSGLILLTTDGKLANQMMHPSSEIEREYAVRVLGQVTDEMIAQMKKGVRLEDGVAAFDHIEEAGGRGANRWYHVVLKEGRKREVRRLWESQHVKVSRLIRVRYGVVYLPSDLKAGKFAELSKENVKALKKSLESRA